MNINQKPVDIALKAIESMNAYDLLKSKLLQAEFSKKLLLVSIGKAAWGMAKAAIDVLDELIEEGVCITKYKHIKGKIRRIYLYEAGHPLPDENSIIATEKVLDLIRNNSKNNDILFLVSGGGSSLFEKPLPGVTLEDLIRIYRKLIFSGALIQEINIVRKHLSAVKAGRFAELVYPALIRSFVLSDVVGNDLSSIASGPISADRTTSEQALEIISKYNIKISENFRKSTQIETPKIVENSDYSIIGNVELLCREAAEIAEQTGCRSKIIRADFSENIKLVSEIIFKHIQMEIKKKKEQSKPSILIFGGEPVVNVGISGKGGRNQHLALLMAKKLSGINNVCFVSIASDGTDGPTDAAGGIVDGSTWQQMQNSGMAPDECIQKFNSYNCLKSNGNLIITGPTGTNVNDLMLAFIT